MINVTKAYLPDRKKLDKYIDRIYDTHWLTNFGPLHNELEERLKEYLGIDHMVLMSNGTLPLQVAMHLFGLKGEVITTPFSFVATTSAIMWEKLCPVFADIDPKTYCIDPKEVETKITEHTSAILPVHVYGNACDVEELEIIAKKNDIKLIYDAAHAFGVKYKGESLLKWGDAATLSFHATKLYHTIEGGALITRDAAAEEEAKAMINFGFNNGEIEKIGINAKMNEFSAAMGLAILDDIDLIIEQREIIYNKYASSLSDQVEFIKVKKEVDFNYAYCPVKFESEDDLLQVMSILDENNINARRYFYPSLDTLNFIDEQRMIISSNTSDKVLCLPIYPGLSQDHQNDIIKLIREVL